jgi:beta-N-acetylhexosaminidase
MAPRAFITGLAGTTITPDERSFLHGAAPWGLILFKRNIGNPAQVHALTNEFRSICGRDDVPVLVDQEGGRVQRLGPPHWPAYPAGAAFGRLYARDRPLGLRAARLGARLIAADLTAVGITVDCLPLADVPVTGSDRVIGDRAYGDTPDQVSAIATEVAEGLASGGVLPVVKHLPGHGRRPSHPGKNGFCRVQAARHATAGHDRPCCIHSSRPGITGYHLGGYHS